MVWENKLKQEKSSLFTIVSVITHNCMIWKTEGRCFVLQVCMLVCGSHVDLNLQTLVR